MAPPLQVAFRTGGVAGMFCVGLGLIGATLIMMIFQNTSSAILVGFGFGGSLLALFLRVGGGIFTKAADVGADLVGKVEAGIPEDDPRNPATIADNVGDNVGDCAGMAADLFESYEVTLVASIILGVPAFQRIFPDQPALWAVGAIFPLAARAIGVLASIVGVFMVRATETTSRPWPPSTGASSPPASSPCSARWPRPGLRRQPRRHDRQRRPAHVRRRGHRPDPGPGGQPHHRVLHLDRDHAGAGDRRRRRDRPGHHRAGRHLVGPGVVGVGHRRHRRRPRASPSASAAATPSSRCTSWP